MKGADYEAIAVSPVGTTYRSPAVKRGTSETLGKPAHEGLNSEGVA